ncbi:MAG: branched-chain amino acid transaminase [Patescibacteria group bacterium]
MSSSAPLKYSYFQDKIVPVEEAKISIMSKVVQYGMGWFGGVRGYISKDGSHIYIFRLDDHIERFLSSARILGVSIKYSKEELKEIFKELTVKNSPVSDTYYRPFAYSDSTDMSPSLLQSPVFAFSLYMLPLGDYLPTNEGNSVCVSSWRRISDNAIPSRAKLSGAYVNSALAKYEAAKNGFVEAIELDEAGHVTEGTAMNLFIVRNGKLITSSASSDILEGITRRTVFEIAKDNGIETVERQIDRTELYVSDEAFFCGTGAQIAWISQIDHRKVGNGKMGKITETIRDQFYSAVRGENVKYEKWLTKIKLK